MIFICDPRPLNKIWSRLIQKLEEKNNNWNISCHHQRPSPLKKHQIHSTNPLYNTLESERSALRSSRCSSRVSGAASTVRRFWWPRTVVTMGAMEANAARTQLFGQDWAELQSRAQLHAHGRCQVLLRQQGESCTVDELVPKCLEGKDQILLVNLIKKD